MVNGKHVGSTLASSSSVYQRTSSRYADAGNARSTELPSGKLSTMFALSAPHATPPQPRIASGVKLADLRALLPAADACDVWALGDRPLVTPRRLADGRLRDRFRTSFVPESETRCVVFAFPAAVPTAFAFASSSCSATSAFWSLMVT
ncbi:hypothetical protein MTO96_001529 [Rhipicephalus appendiculatus]